MTDRRGFTLLEMLVALAVFSLAAMALLNLSGESVRSAARVRDRALGGVVADNVAAEAVLAQSLPVGAQSGRADLAGRPWRWSRVVTATSVPNMGRVEIRVYSGDEQVADRVLFKAASA